MKQRTRHDNPLVPSAPLVPLVLLVLSVPLVLLVLFVLLVLRLICPIRPIGPICLINSIWVLLIPSPLSGSPPPRGRSGGGFSGKAGRGLLGEGRKGAAGCVGWGSYGWAVRAAGFGCLHKQKSPPGFLSKGFSKKGGYLLSHGCAVPSARAGLTSLFGMGRGGTPPL